MAWSEWKKFGNEQPSIVKVTSGVKIVTTKKPTYIFIPAIWSGSYSDSAIYYYFDFSQNTCRHIDAWNNIDNTINLSEVTDISVLIEDDGFTITNNVSVNGVSISHILLW